MRFRSRPYGRKCRLNVVAARTRALHGPGMRDVGVLLYDGVQALDAVGPFEALHAASLVASQPAYRLRMLSIDGRSVRSETGIGIASDGRLDEAGALHTLIVPGGATARSQPPNPNLIAALKTCGPRAERLVSICTGTFLVAEAGLIGDRRVSTHWKFAGDLSDRHPELTVDADRLYIADRGLFSSAGILAGIDLTLAIIEADLGEAIAMSVARNLVIYLRRSGGQAQFSEPLRNRARLAGRFAKLGDWIRENLDQPLPVEVLASRMGLSPRHLRRVLRDEIGVTPAHFVENVRLDLARELLAVSEGDIKQIASLVGFTGDDSFRRAFRRRFLLSPSVYRERFNFVKPGRHRSPNPPSCPAER